MSGAAKLVEQLTRIAHLHVEEAGLRWPHDAKRARVIAVEIGNAYRAAGIEVTRARAEIFPLYWNVDDGELSGAYGNVGISISDMAMGLLDLIAERATEEAPAPLSFASSCNWRVLLTRIGEASIVPVMAVLSEALKSRRIDHVRLERRAWPVDADGDEIVGDGEPPMQTAAIDNFPDGWEEEGFARCSPGDDHARAIVRGDIDEEPLAPLIDLITERGKIALAALRGEPPT